MMPSALRRPFALFLAVFLVLSTPLEAASKKKKSNAKKPASTAMTARAYAVVDAGNGRILVSKNPHLKLPPASTTKVMTVLIVRERLKMDARITVGRTAANAAPSKAGLTPGASYAVRDLITAALVASSNDAAVALAEGVAGSEWKFVQLMNAKAKKLGMHDTKFVNATGLPDKKLKQYTTAFDLTKLMRAAARDKEIDERMAIVETYISGSDGKLLTIRAHNKMLWKKPKSVKGKTGWTFASRHTFVGTDYSPRKSIAFAMLSSQTPWNDIERLFTLGRSQNRR